MATLILSAHVRASAAADKVQICHFPPGNTNNYQTITIAANALPAHLAHGDFPGPCANGCNLFATICDDHNACTADRCNAATGQCLHSAPKDCDDGNVCTDDTCNPTTGVCVNTPHPDLSCDDRDACSYPDTCSAAGVCVGTKLLGCCLSNGDCNDGNPCTADVCSGSGGAAGTCSHSPISCTDDDPCTVDACNELSGLCEHAPKACTVPADQCHEAAACDATTGACVNQEKPDGTPCTDGNVCTDHDTCEKGTCVSGPPKICTASDQCHDAGACDPTAGCPNPPKADDANCDDGNPCTLTDTCQAGTCQGGNDKVCAALDDCHVPGVCDPTTGACSDPVTPNGTSCNNDGNACTQTDTCHDGVCTGSNPIVCAPIDQCHTAGTCDPRTGQCSTPAVTDDTACDDQNPCTLNDSCQSGVCVAGEPKPCNAVDQCHDQGTCDPMTGTCSNPQTQDGASCDDGNACTLNDACKEGVCRGGNDVACIRLDQCHIKGTCDPHSGVCTNPEMADGTGCDNPSNKCNKTNTCQAGVCTGSDPVVCAPIDQCHEPGSCDPATGTCSNPAKADGADCNDGNACTQSDTCVNGACVGSNPVVCPLPDQCHDAGACDPTTGVCSNPVPRQGTGCDDGNACTLTDTCVDGMCTGSNNVACTASDQCHDVGACNPATGLCTDPAKDDGISCNNPDNLCYKTYTCRGGACSGSSPVDCARVDQCHTDGTCIPATGTCTTPPAADGTACADGNACTANDTCQAGNCVSGPPMTCPSPGQCQLGGGCDPAAGTCSYVNKANGTTCNDGNPATVDDVCAAGQCAGCAPNANANPRFVDNGDGTITDRKTCLMWEKKDDAGGIHDKDNTYTWSLWGCGPSCPFTGSANWAFLYVLNTPPCFANHCDWRLPAQPYPPALRELESILAAPYPCGVRPCVPAAFNTNCQTGCTVAGGGNTQCSCTQGRTTYPFPRYWSSTTCCFLDYSASWVDFSDGNVGYSSKTDPPLYVRAVRGGS